MVTSSALTTNTLFCPRVSMIISSTLSTTTLLSSPLFKGYFVYSFYHCTFFIPAFVGLLRLLVLLVLFLLLFSFFLLFFFFLFFFFFIFLSSVFRVTSSTRSTPAIITLHF